MRMRRAVHAEADRCHLLFDSVQAASVSAARTARRSNGNDRHPGGTVEMNQGVGSATGWVARLARPQIPLNQIRGETKCRSVQCVRARCRCRKRPDDRRSSARPGAAGLRSLRFVGSISGSKVSKTIFAIPVPLDSRCACPSLPRARRQVSMDRPRRARR